jgi:hypothetical protein
MKNKMSKYIAWVILPAAVLCYFLTIQCSSSNLGGNSQAGVVDYNFHVRPILSDRCFACHGPDANKRQAGLRLDTEEGAYAALKDSPGKHGIIPGNLEKSEVFQRMITEDPNTLMPPPNSNLKITKEEVAVIEKWIKQGAKYKKHWAFIAPKKADLPKADAAWTKNPIDNFVYAGMKQKGLSPAEEADKETLLKRVSMDLTGLPPTVQMQDEFLADNSPNAYTTMVSKLMKSKHYGERMALSWLDVARYADSHGYQDDMLRTMWPWRDWVIHAFNSNYSYKKFVTWQLAGDIMAAKVPNHKFAKEMTLATGFNRNHKITQEGGVIDEEYRVEYVSDRTNTFGKAFMALTFECSKCHDHKYDPISQKDYFGTFAFFNQVPEKGLGSTAYNPQLAEQPSMRIEKQDVNSLLKFINLPDSNYVDVMVMGTDTAVRKTHLLLRGNYDAIGPEVDYGLPKAILPFNNYPKDRVGLTKWMFDERNPITARVYVNRIWAQFFGRGIVKTTGDFGMQGELPSHPELLDWLAVDFMEHNWDIKRLVGQIVSSATYRQSSKINQKHIDTDPENIYLSRASRIRFPAEIVRDQVLASSNLLNNTIGGPSVKVYQPKGLWESATSGRGHLARYFQDFGKALYRRGMYVFIKRTVPPPTMILFDGSNRDQCEVQRGRTNTPLQALAMLNDPHVLEASSYLANTVMTQKMDLDKSIEQVFRQIMCRKPKSKELSILKSYYAEELAFYKKNKNKALALQNIGEFQKNKSLDISQYVALMQTFQMIYNSEEAIVRI